MSKIMEDLSGQKFGRLLVLRYGEPSVRKNGRHNTTFVCRCDCGNEVTVLGVHLKNGNTSSCGCLHRETTGNINKRHGKKNERLYSIWCRMKQRCSNKNTKEFEYYGGKGICVCDEWATDFEAFYEWAMNNGYSEELTIDRIDIDKDYCPENCRWATRKEQANNTSKTRLITVGNETHSLAEWGRISGIDRRVISKRIDALGWSVEDAISVPTKKVEVKNERRISNEFVSEALKD